MNNNPEFSDNRGKFIFHCSNVLMPVTWALWFFWTKPLWLTITEVGVLPDRPWQLVLHNQIEISILFLILSSCFGYNLWFLKNARNITDTERISLFVSIAASILIVLAAFPIGSPDLFHYLAETQRFVVQHSHPYLNVPSQYVTDPFMKYDFLPDSPLGYGPLWLFLTSIPGKFTGYERVIPLIFGLKILNLLFLSGMGIMLSLFFHERAQKLIAFYSLMANPLVLFEGISNAHNDIIQVFFLTLAIFFINRKPWITSSAFAAGILIKFFNIFLSPLFLAEGFIQKWPLTTWIRSITSGAVIFLLSFIPLGPGKGILPGLYRGITEATKPFYSASLLSLSREYLTNRGLTPSGEHFLLIIFSTIFLGLIFVLLWFRLKGMPFIRCLSIGMGGFLILISLNYPWYLLNIIPIMILDKTRVNTFFALIISTLGFLYYPVTNSLLTSGIFTTFSVHLIQAILITAPIIFYILILFTLETLRLEQAGSDYV